MNNTEQELTVVKHNDAMPMPTPIRQGIREASISALAPKSFLEVAEMAKMMAMADSMVGAVCRGNMGNSAAIIMQAVRWGMDPFAISHEAFVVSGNMGYGAKLINAVIQSNAPIQGRLSYEYTGDIKDRTRSVRVFATFTGETAVKDIVTPQLQDIKTQNSPLWKSDPDQQLAYYGARAWARRHAPDVLMGVISRDEIEDNPEMRNVTPVKAESSSLEDSFKSRIESAKTLDDLRDIQADIRASDIDGFNRVRTLRLLSDKVTKLTSNKAQDHE